MNLNNKIKVLALLTLCPLGMYAQTVNPTLKVLPLDPAVRTGKLANGFTYYIRHNDEPKKRVLMYIVNKAGSVLEDEDQRGLAHFMEHMSFNGTAHFPHNQLVDYLQKAGVRFGADINAYTSFDETVYQLPLPADKPAILHDGLLIMHDWAQSAALDSSEIDKERGVVLEEKRLGKGAGERMQRQYWPVILNNSRYAVRVPIGLDTVLDNFQRPAIARFYHDWYRPDLQALIIVGDINADSLERVVKVQFADLKNPANERPRPDYIVPLTGENHFLAITDHEMMTTQAELVIKHPSLPLKTTADYRKNIIQVLFNQMLAARFAELSRQSDPPFVEASANIGSFFGGTGIFDANLNARPGGLEKGFKAVWRETERLKRFGFTATELERTKQSYKNGMETALKEKDKTSSESFVKEYQKYFLKEIAAPGIETEYKLTKEYLPGITLADVNDLAVTCISSHNRDVLVLGPEKEKALLPNEATIDKWMKAVEQEKLQPYQDEVSLQALLTHQPVPGRIKNEVKDEVLGITTFTLSNGLKVLIKPTNFKNEEIRFNAFAAGGTSVVSDADFQSAANAANIIPAGGLGNYSLTQLGKYLEGKQVSVKPFIADRFEGISGSTTPKDLEIAMQLIYGYFTEPRKDTAIFKNIMERSKASLISRGGDPKKVFSDTVSNILGNHNSRRTAPTIAKLTQVDLDRAYTIYKERFADAAGFTFTFIGNVDIAVIKPLLEKYLGGLPATHSREQAKDLNVHIPEGKIEKTVFKGSEPQSTVLLVYSGNFDYSPENKMRLDAVKECLEIRLLQRLREEEGGVYSPVVAAVTTKFPQSRFSLIIQFGCAPQNVDKLIASTLDEVRKLRSEGPMPENVNKWRQEAKNSREPQLKTNEFWQGYINQQLQNQDGLNELNNYNTLLDSVKPVELKAIADRYLNGENFIKLILMPEYITAKITN
jgi:zinc protease